MQHTSFEHGPASKRLQRPMVGLRMDAAEFEQCKALAEADARSAGQFALLMYRRGLEAWEAERGASRSARRR
ncbi:hypothetical protein D3C87_1048510 [compost metagenome]